MTSKSRFEHRLTRDKTHWTIGFDAMASPCEILVRCKTRSEAEQLASLALSETRRIEQTFSRYRDDNIVYKINHSDGAAIAADDELARLLNYAEQCYRLSDGLFDITSGVLRRAWRFDGSEYAPDEKLIASIQELVGWDKVAWDGESLRLRPGMEIDFGGIGKEYAVDIVAELLFRTIEVPVMVNFGGDIRAITSDPNPIPWVVGIESPDRENSAVGEIKLTNGGVATSGDLRRFCLVNGQRLGHILNPRTGWPVAGAPRSVTVLGNYCVEAGFLATLSILHGSDAESFLESQDAQAHCVR
jgi:thiamine biosynthesis lipoprotein